MEFVERAQSDLRSSDAREISTTSAAKLIGRSSEHVRQLVHSGKVQGRTEAVGGSRSRIWVDVDSLAAYCAEIPTLSPEPRSAVSNEDQRALSTADLEIAMLRAELVQTREELALKDAQAEIRRLRADNVRLRAVIDTLLAPEGAPGHGRGNS